MITATKTGWVRDGNSTLTTGTGGGSAALSGAVSGITLSYSYPDGFTGIPDIAMSCTPPGGTFKGVALYLEHEDQSPLPAAVADGTFTADGSAAAGGEWKPQFLIKQDYSAGDRVVFSLGQIVPWERTIRVIVNAYNTDGVENPLVRPGEAGATPSATLVVEPLDIGPTGEEYCKNPTNITRTLKGGFEGPTHWTEIAHAWDGPQGGDGVYIETMWHDVDGQERYDAAVYKGNKGTTRLQTPKAPKQVRFRYFGFRDQFPGVEDDLVNTYAPGVTPEFFEPIGITSGTVDLGEGIAATVSASMAVLNKVLGVAASGITEDLVAVFAISQDRLKNAQIIDAARIVDAAVQNSKLAALSVDTAKLAAAAVGTSNLADLAVQAAKLDTAAVTSTKIANLAVGNAAMQALAVGVAQIQDLAVSTAKMDNFSVTNAKMAALSVGSANIQALAVGTAQIQDAAITTTKITNAAITNALIASLAVGTAQIQDLAVTSAKIASLDVGKLTAGTMSLPNSTSGITVQYSILSTTVLPTGFQVFSSGSMVAALQDGLLTVGKSTDSSFFQLNSVFIPATSATGGSATALPAQPVGYLNVTIGGASRKIPFYS